MPTTKRTFRRGLISPRGTASRASVALEAEWQENDLRTINGAKGSIPSAPTEYLLKANRLLDAG